VATATLTEEQWNSRLADMGKGLNQLAGDATHEDNRLADWKEKITRGIGMAAMAAIYYPRAKADLEKLGWTKDELDRMAISQVVLLHMSQTYEVLRDDMFKWFHIPFWQSEAITRRADDNLKTVVKERELLPLASLLLPAIQASRFAVTRVDRQFAAMRTVEALRYYAAKHDGKLPEKLDAITEVPVPLDPVTGKSFDYKLEGDTATLEGKSPGNRPAATGAFRYIITLAEKKSDGAKKTPAEQKTPADQKAPGSAGG
jgi:hypothetical protein